MEMIWILLLMTFVLLVIFVLLLIFSPKKRKSRYSNEKGHEDLLRIKEQII